MFWFRSFMRLWTSIFKSFPNLTFHQLWKLLHNNFTSHHLTLHFFLTEENRIWCVSWIRRCIWPKTENTFHFSSSRELSWLRETYNCQPQKHLEVKISGYYKNKHLQAVFILLKKIVERKNPSYNKINYCPASHPKRGFPIKGIYCRHSAMYMTASVLTAAAALLPVSCDNLDGSKQFTHPRVHRTLVSHDILLSGPLSKYLSHNFKNCYSLYPLLEFHNEYCILKALNSSMIKSPLILFILFFLKFIWPQFSFLYKTQS